MSENTPKNTADRKELNRQRYESALENFNQKEVKLPAQVAKRNRRWLSLAILVVAIAIGVYLIVRMSGEMGDEQKSFQEAFSAVSLRNLLLALAVLSGVIVADVTKYIVAIHATTGQLHPLIGAKTSFLGRYYDNITPFASGGQPMQIYYLYHKGFSGGLSTAMVMIKFFFSNTFWLLVAGVCMGFNTHVLQGLPNGKLLLGVGWAGWGINALMPLGLMLFVTMPRLAGRVTRGVIHLGRKLHIVKNEQKAIASAEAAVDDFRSSFVIMSKRPVHAVLLALSCAVEVSLTFALPYFVIKMLNGFAVDEGFATMFEVMALHAFAIFGASVVPTPGNSGAVEALITLAFSSLAGATLMWVILTWRFASFYLYIIIGVGISLFNLIRGIIRARSTRDEHETSVATSEFAADLVPASADEASAARREHEKSLTAPELVADLVSVPVDEAGSARDEHEKSVATFEFAADLVPASADEAGSARDEHETSASSDTAERSVEIIVDDADN